MKALEPAMIRQAPLVAASNLVHDDLPFTAGQFILDLSNKKAHYSAINDRIF
jgi:hypothetical protein